jgi:hypothetical protein
MHANRNLEARSLTLIAALLAAVMLLPTVASAQSKSDVKIDAAVATNAAVMGGSKANQNVNIGSAK